MLQRLYFSIFFSISFLVASGQEKKVIENNADYQFQSEKNQTTQTQTQTQTRTKKTYQYQPSWSFGGNIGLSFWNNGTDILIAPKAYYNVSPQFLAGFGLTYIYSSQEDDFAKYSQNSFGPSVMGAFRPVPFLQLSAEYEGLQTNGDSTIKFGDREKNSYSYWNNALYLGASFVSRNVSFGVRYDVLYDSTRSVYSSAWSPVIGFYF
ncbi:alpha-ketoglutarate decarboxylase [Lutimonas zeaxanthinifaciens]|uniref:alpha-ketoglutarate decarboxylase n=1 Tax=Lutimonas zeaxanthinifaciens TaxID=3060215 RepID=UPI00265CFFC0|nr:alpha-ketoglutarate decarboxylase [Lutimonas sp. YSD2104]WKK65786.1 alpha-ketoglutarate decarboxylase [Lutimonas sp. YSD2104]